jgi:hypothetical protein
MEHLEGGQTSLVAFRIIFRVTGAQLSVFDVSVVVGADCHEPFRKEAGDVQGGVLDSAQRHPYSASRNQLVQSQFTFPNGPL